MPIKAPYFSEGKLREAAKEFLDRHYPSRELPIPIEAIIERDFGMDIVPVPGLHRHFDIDAFITSDLIEIRVDQAVWESRENRYRFSLAHELAHKLLHQSVFAQIKFATVGEWKASRGLIPEKEYRFLEWHANVFAGLVLVPPEKLSAAFERAKNTILESGNSLDDAPPYIWDWLEDRIAREFVVSAAVIGKRGPADGLWEA